MNITEISLHEIAENVNSLGLEQDMLTFEARLAHGMPASLPIRFNALIIIIGVAGHCDVDINMRQYSIERDSFVILQPQNYVSNPVPSEDFRAKVMACSPQMTNDFIPKLSDLLPLLMQLSAEPIVNLLPEQSVNINIYYDFITEQLRNPRSKYTRKKIRCLLQAAFYEVLDSLESTRLMKPRTRQEEIMAEFLQLLLANFKTAREVSLYANQMNITPKHLSSVVKSLSGRTAGEWIDAYVIMEAKILLTTTDMTVQQIAYALNFSSQAFFGKYFRNLTSFTPTAYRAQNR
jgi:AraC-like DNA-binding protein